MKTKKSMEQSAKACINQITRHCVELSGTAQRQKLKANTADIAKMRELAGAIMKSTHEYSAYYNCMETV